MQSDIIAICNLFANSKFVNNKQEVCFMKDLAATIQKWDELRRQGTSETVERILQEAQKLLEERIAEGKYEGELCISYWDKSFEIEMEYHQEIVAQKAKIPFTEIEKVSIILKRVMATFKEFSQLEVTTRPFGHQSSIYDIEYNIVVQLK